jgi:hypothetical protein
MPHTRIRERFEKENNYRVKVHYCKNCDHCFTTKYGAWLCRIDRYHCMLMPEGDNRVSSDSECDEYAGLPF